MVKKMNLIAYKKSEQISLRKTESKIWLLQ